MRTVRASTISTWLKGAKGGAPRILFFGSTRRSRLNFTASASTGSPFWNFTFGRSLNSHTVGATSFGISLASAGCILSSASRSSSVSKMLRQTLPAGVSWWFMGSSVVGSTPWAMTTLPCGAPHDGSGMAAIRATVSASRSQVMNAPSWDRTERPGPPCTAPERLPRLLQRHVVGLDQLIASGLPADALVRAIEIDLLVERGRCLFVEPELVDPVVLGEPLLLVHHGLRLVDHAVEVRVVVVAEQAPGAEERHVDALGIHHGLPPADEPHGPCLVDVDHVVEVVHELERLQRGLDTSLGQLAC